MGEVPDQRRYCNETRATSRSPMRAHASIARRRMITNRLRTRAPSDPLSIVIATPRKPPGAVAGQSIVQALAAHRGHQVQLLGMTTKGDQILDRSLSKVGARGCS